MRWPSPLVPDANFRLEARSPPNCKSGRGRTPAASSKNAGELATTGGTGRSARGVQSYASAQPKRRKSEACSGMQAIVAPRLAGTALRLMPAVSDPEIAGTVRP